MVINTNVTRNEPYVKRFTETVKREEFEIWMHHLKCPDDVKHKTYSITKYLNRLFLRSKYARCVENSRITTRTHVVVM